MVYEIKTKKNDNCVTDFLNSVSDEKRREDGFKVLKLLEKWTKNKPSMYGDAIIGFGNYAYGNENCKGEWFSVGFSPRKAYLSLYFMAFGDEVQEDLMQKIGSNVKVGKCCVNVKKFEDLDLKVFEKITKLSMKHVKKQDWYKG